MKKPWRFKRPLIYTLVFFLPKLTTHAATEQEMLKVRRTNLLINIARILVKVLAEGRFRNWEKTITGF